MCQYNKKIYIAKFDDDERVKIKKIVLVESLLSTLALDFVRKVRNRGLCR